jgi:hypothetical protein
MINQKVLEVFIKYDIKSFPVDCKYIVNKLGYNLFKYSELSEEKRNSCLMVSDESLMLHNNIYYNDDMVNSRIRFSISHEIGHIILNHGEYMNPIKEAEANCFASCLLAPRMAIHYAKCKNQNDVVKIFHISQEAAQYAFDDYRRWYRWIVIHKMAAFDKAMYQHFYNADANCFVYSVKKCAYCESEIYNSPDILCKECKTPTPFYLQHPQYDDDLLVAENHWLYSGL